MRVIPKQNVGELSIKASGTLPDGSPVVIDSNNEVSVVEDTRGVIGDETKVMNNSRVDYPIAVFDSHHNRVVIFYKDYSSNTNAEHGKAVVYTVDSTNNTLKDAGSIVTFNSSATNYISACFDSNANKILVAYSNGGDSNQGYAIVGEVDPSDNSITFGTHEEFYNNTVYGIETAFNTQHNVVGILYGNESNHPNFVVAEIDSGATTMTFGSELEINGTQAGFSGSLGICFDTQDQRWVVVYRGASTRAYTNAIAYNGSSTTLHGQVTITSFDGSNVTESYSKVVFIPAVSNTITDSGGTADDGNHVVYLYQQAGTRGIAVVANCSGGTITVDNTRETIIGDGWASNTGGISFQGAVWNSSTNRLILCYIDANNSSYVTFIEGHMVLGANYNKINFSDERHLLSVGTNGQLRLAYDSTSNRVIMTHSSNTNNNEGVAYVYKPSNEAKGYPQYKTNANSYGVNNRFMTYDETAQRLVVTFGNINDSNKFYVMLGTISGVNITWHTPQKVTDDVPNYGHCPAYDASTGKTVLFWSSSTSTQTQYVVISAINTSDNTCTFGSIGNWNVDPGAGGNNQSNYIQAHYDPHAQKIIVFFSDNANNSNRASAIVCTVNGGANTASFGTKVAMGASGTASGLVADYDTVNRVWIATYRISNVGYATALEISGTTIVPAQPSGLGTGQGHIRTTFDSTSGGYDQIAYDPFTGKFVVSFIDSANNDYVKAVTLEWAGGRIKVGSVNILDQITGTTTGLAFDQSISRFVLAYRDGTGNYGWQQNEIKVRTGQIGSSPTHLPIFGTPSQIYNTPANSLCVLYVPSIKKSIVYFYANSGSAIFAQVYDYAGSNLQANNHIGFTKGGTVSSGDKAIVQTTGTVNDKQSGLTVGSVHYVQQDGSLSTSPSDPRVVAGKALSATELLVKAE